MTAGAVAARAWLLAAWLAGGFAPPTWAQSVITSQPLPPPAGVPGKAAARPPPGHAPSRPAPKHVPVVRPQHAPLKKAAPARAGRPAATPAPKLAAKPAAKPATRPATRPGAPEPAAARPATPPPPRLDPTKGSTTGLPLPRWAAFRSDDVNLRSGPGMQYPIQWVYHRRDLPVQILREFEVWRLIQEQDGTKGWVHEATLTGRRGFVVQGGEQVLRASAAATAGPVAMLEPGVVGHVRHCDAAADWCDVQAGDYHGWLKREAMYGISPGEAIQ